MNSSCHVELLGALRFSAGREIVDRFRTKKVAELFAYLAFHRDRMSTREELANVLWPDEYSDSARMNRLSNALSALRTQLESASMVKGSVLSANRYEACLRPETVSVDVLDFKAAVKACSRTKDLSEKIELAERAFHLYRGDFAPILDSDWIFAERVRLQDTYALLLANLRDRWAEVGELSPAIDYGSRLLEADPYNESSHIEMIRLYLAAGRNSAAHDQFAALGKVLEEMDAKPSQEAIAVMRSVPEMPPTVQRAPISEEPRVMVSMVSAPLPQHERVNKPSLPFQTTRFFGREEEIAFGVAVLRREGTRLISLIGPGGSGKTRLSIEIARAASELYDGSVYFAPLADVDNPALIHEAILGSIGAHRQVSSSPPLQIASALGENPISLLVLDNVEQIVDHMSKVVEELLSLLPGLKIIATSRRTLNLTGETGISVPPLPLPTPNKSLLPSEMIGFPSIALFVDRAQHVCADFQLTQRNAPAVAELCQKLDGMPLPIELAATWAKTLSPQQMLHQLARRFDLLVTRRRDVPIRHQRMVAIIESSYMQLEPELREFFVKLSVFEAGWTLEAAAWVCDNSSAMSHLQELLERTLVTSAQLDTNDGDSTMRFGMLETIKAFGESQLDSDDKNELLLAHVSYFANHARSKGHGLNNYQMAMPLQSFVADLPNYRLALATSIDRGLWSEPAAILLHTYQGWEALGLFDELLNWVDHIPTSDMDPRTEAFIVRHRARCYFESGQKQVATQYLEDCLSRFQQLGEMEGVSGTLANLASAAFSLGDTPTAIARISEALLLASDLGNKPLLARMTVIHSGFLLENGDLDSARKGYLDVLRLTEWQTASAAAACNFLADLEIHSGNYSEAETLSKAALDILKKTPSLRHERASWLNLGRCAFAQGSLGLAKEYYQLGLDLDRSSYDPQWVVALTAEMARVSESREDFWSALVLITVATYCFEGAAQEYRSRSQRQYDEKLSPAVLSIKLGEGRAQKAIALGRTLSPADAIRFVEEFLENLVENSDGSKI
jgi:predicted ATPase/DNA-binding SARP family transcriptional activator